MISQVKHRQSLPNLSSTSKLSIVTTSSRSSEQHRSVAAASRHASAQAPTTTGKVQPRSNQQSQGASKLATSRQRASPAQNFKSAVANEHSPLSAKLPAKTNSQTPRQTSRIVASSRYDIARSARLHVTYTMMLLIHQFSRKDSIFYNKGVVGGRTSLLRAINFCL